MTVVRRTDWNTLVHQADPDHGREKREIAEYDFSSARGSGRNDERTTENGRRVFKANYDQRGAYSGAWQSAVAAGSYSGDSTGWDGWTFVQVIESALLDNLGGRACRLTLRAGNNQAGCIKELYIGHAALTGNPYDFDQTPVQVRVNGQTEFVLAPGSSTITDIIDFEILTGRNLVFSAYFENAAQDHIGDLEPSPSGMFLGYYYTPGRSEAGKVVKTGIDPLDTGIDAYGYFDEDRNLIAGIEVYS